MFVCPKGKVMMQLDYSQAELRVVAGWSQDKQMLEWFRVGHDIHLATACKKYKISYEDAYKIYSNEDDPDFKIWKVRRKQAKTIGFGVLYQQGPNHLKESLSTPVAGVTALLWWFDTASYDKLCLMMFSGMTFCLILYMVLPNGLDIRPTVEEVGRSNIAMTLMQLIWKADASVNVCPSIHCQSSACMAIAFSGSTLAKDRPWLKVLAFGWAALICASTVFTKQHSIIDVFCGLAVAFIWVPVLYLRPRKR